MYDVGTIAAVAFGLVGAFTGIYSMTIQRRQTQIMEAGLERALDDDLSESDAGTALEKRIRELINRRLADARKTIRQEFTPRLTEIEEQLKDANIRILAGMLVEVRNAQKTATEEIATKSQSFAEETERAKTEIVASEQRILAESGKYDADISAHGREIESLEQQFERIREAVSSQEQARIIMRLLGEQLLRMAN